MDFSFSAEEEAFRQDVRSFLSENLSERIRAGSRASPGVFVEPDIGQEWQSILAEKGWLTYYWPKEYGGMGWTPTQRYIYEKELALADAPFLPVLGIKLLGPIICRFGTEKQKKEILPRIISGEDYWCQMAINISSMAAKFGRLTPIMRPIFSVWCAQAMKVQSNKALVSF